MTQPAPQSDAPRMPRDCPTVSFMITSSLSQEAGNTPVAWITGQPHPLLGPDMSVVGMFTVDGGVEVYSISQVKKGIRNFIPMHWVRYVQETMPFQVFLEELESAALDALEPDDDDDDDGSDDEPGDEPTNPGANFPSGSDSSTSNGQAGS